jgi:sugar/nucleoside kinase (ribokinase family)
MKTNIATIYGVGLIALDIIDEDEQLSYALQAGGTCGNVLSLLATLGWNAYAVGRIASDPPGSRVLKDLSRCGVKTDLATLLPGAPTPVIVHRIRKSLSGEGTHSFSFFCPTCGHRLPRYRPISVAAAQVAAASISQIEVLFVDRVSPGVRRLAEHAKERDAIIYFEPSASGDLKHTKALLEMAHILKYSQERRAEVRSFGSGRATLIEIETLGSAGLRFRTALGASRERWIDLPAASVISLKDAGGAGDWLTSGLIHNLCANGLRALQTASQDAIIESLVIGQRAAAWNCGFIGARGGMGVISRRDLAHIFDNDQSHVHALRPNRHSRGANRNSMKKTICVVS